MPVGPQNYPVELLSLTETPAAEGSADPRSAEARPLTHSPPPSDARGARLALGPRPLEADLRGRRGTRRRRARRSPRPGGVGSVRAASWDPGLRQQQLEAGFPPPASRPADAFPLALRERERHRQGYGAAAALRSSRSRPFTWVLLRSRGDSKRQECGDECSGGERSIYIS